MTVPVLILPYALLALSMLSLWHRKTRKLWPALFAVALTAAWMTNRIAWPGVLAVLAFGGLAWAYYRRARDDAWKALFAVGIAVLSLLLFHHQIPGFDNLKLLDRHRFSADALPYSLYLNFDKGSVGLFLLACGWPLIATRQDWQRMLARSLPAFALGCGVILLLSLALGYVRFDVKLPEALALWAFKMLFFTVVAEEAFFRGFVQGELTRRWRGRRGGETAAWVTASVLFGLDHFGGGPLYIALATVAGLFYGWVLRKTGRIEASILFHLLLNTLHLLFFSYPALASVAG
ncbi:CPBP family intramembrane glutamic endopeptidase [Nitrospina gracilis]|uniref:CPBP family intramembrane glutamic endopeptidase n=1 Tax=Nitrospina gracilis TaxID=35801 RepID=UPI001F36D2B7|nr:CPBP family intramembrane glutamic endopeptidase [Nitrospina gracilis]MCF8721566.1 membrane protease YdiL (CAAX protease family) [Nitrospina gracilis Nb-211]